MIRKFLACLLLVASQTYADPGDSQSVAFAADPGQSCAVFIGSFDFSNWQGVHPAKPTVKCNLVEKEGASCILTNHGIPGLGTLQFKGNFIWKDGNFLVEGSDRVLMLRLVCTNPGHCPTLQVWNVTNFVGFACDIHSLHSPVRKPAKPPQPDNANSFIKI